MNLFGAKLDAFSDIDFDKVFSELSNTESFNYEDSVLKEQSDDIKQHFNKQIESIEKIANSAEIHSTSSVEIAESAKLLAKSSIDEISVLKEHLKLAIEDSKSAKIDAAFSKFFSIVAILISILAILLPRLGV